VVGPESDEFRRLSAWQEQRHDNPSKGLTTLTLDFGSFVGGSVSLDALKELKGLTTLTLNFGDGTRVSSLDALKELKGLTTLTLLRLYEFDALPKSLLRLHLSAGPV
jgi:hypothetical protein